jgi:hypothetical protein
VRFERLAAHEEILQILQNIFLRRRKGAGLRHLLEACHGGTTEDVFLCAW